MYSFVILFHSCFRWLVLVSLVYAIVRAAWGYAKQQPFSPRDNAARHWTATIAHLQLMAGFYLYFTSPFMKAQFAAWKHAQVQADGIFFTIVHIGAMFCAVVLITVGSALAKRRTNDIEKFRTMLVWFSVALVVILLAIPWPFSPWAHRPFIRPF
ncbi:hypothetical protein [Chryseolinea lacunae]|uniref:Cytochrome B n=1 Tax=Chryseolinea lacunae TaxID=2801331 RepID=A0ABS1KM27_9BACT|nr:hypothetical protein [Chryseolinea lacunae]MBL0740378.1 hypothetical protein [Chryseolinea lacunae]